MYKINWGKVGEEILKKRPKITQMFDMLKYPKVLKYQLKPLISLKFKKQSTHSHKISVRMYPHKRYIRIERAFGEEYSIENIKNKICSKYPSREEIIKPKTYDRRLFYKGSIKRLRKAKGIIALYYYYCYLLKVYPKKNLNYKFTPKMRAEVKKMEKYSEQIRFICKYKLETINDVENLKEEKKEELQVTLNTRNRLYYKRQKLDNESEKMLLLKI